MSEGLSLGHGTPIYFIVSTILRQKFFNERSFSTTSCAAISFKATLCVYVSDLHELHHEKTSFRHVQNQRPRSVIAQLISIFVFAFLYCKSHFLDPKFQASLCQTWP